MTASPQVQTQRRIIFVLLTLFAACCLATRSVQALVAADRICDGATIVLELGLLVAFVTIGYVALCLTSRAHVQFERIVLWAMPLIVLLASALFAKTSYADVSVALNALTQTPDGLTTILALGPGGRDIRLSGEITEGAAQRLAALLDAHRSVERIHLTSDGGLADEGEALRKVIAARNLTTFVPDYCVSACTLAFMGGHARVVMSDARLGFHGPFEEGLFGQTFADKGDAERSSYLAAGVAAAFVDQAMKVAPQDVWTPKVERLVEAHVVTGVVDRYRFPASDLDGVDDLGGARESMLRNFPLAKAIQAERPQAIEAVAGWYLDAYREGRSEGDIVDHLKAAIGDAATLAMSGADDETLVGFAKFLLAAMKAADSDEACMAVGREASLIEAEVMLDEDDKGADDLAVALLARALKSHSSSTRAAIESTRASDAGDFALTASRQPCAEIRDLYEKALALPRRDGAALIRAKVARAASELRAPPAAAP